jgi:hypothetical protein
MKNKVSIILATFLLTLSGSSAISQTAPRNPSSRPILPNANSQIALLPDLLITAVEECQPLPLSYPGAPMKSNDAASGKGDCYRLKIKNQGVVVSGPALLEISYALLNTTGIESLGSGTPGHQSTATQIENATVPPLKAGATAWISIPALGSVSPAPFLMGPLPSSSLGTSTLLSFTAVIDPHNVIAESNKSNNKFIKPVVGIGSETSCDLQLANGSKVFVVNNVIYANILVANYGTKGTCSGIKVPTLRVDFAAPTAPASENKIGSTPPWFVGKLVNTTPKDWGAVLNTFQFSCNSVCRKYCLNSEHSQCSADVRIFGYDPPPGALVGTKEAGYYLGHLTFYQQYKGS